MWPQGPMIHTSKARQVYLTIIKALIHGIKRDGKVTIPGLGVFYVRTNKATRRGIGHFENGRKLYQEVVDIPAKTYVAFRPCKAIMKALRDKE